MKSICSIAALFLLCSAIAGCNGAAGRRAAKEAIILFEKKGGSKAASAVEKNVYQAERAAEEEAASSYNSFNRMRAKEKIKEYYEQVEEEPQYYSVPCSNCGGAKYVYMLDFYGNFQYDYYGMPMTTLCPACGGSGSILICQ